MSTSQKGAQCAPYNLSNAPNIGRLDMEKEARWKRESELSFAQFKQAVAYIASLPNNKRAKELDRYQTINGLHARQSLQGYVEAMHPATR